MLTRLATRRLAGRLLVLAIAGSPSFGRAEGPPTAGESATEDPGSVLQRAQAALSAGELRRACELAATVRSEDAAAARARFIEGYARYKLGELEEAARQLERSLVLEDSPQTAFLSALTAFELKRWNAAIVLLEPLASSGKAPWAGPAADLLRRTRERVSAQELEETRLRHARALERATELLKTSRNAEAQQALDEARRAMPGHALNHYYLGYLAYKKGDTLAAQRQFRDALRVKPDDEWSQYMLAISLEDGAPERTRLLERLAAKGSDEAMRQAAREALVTRVVPESSASSFSVLLEIGAGLDTLPGQVSSSGETAISIDPRLHDVGEQPQTVTQESSTAAALQARADFAYQRQLGTLPVASVGLQLFEQVYPADDNGLAQTELRPWIDLTLRTRRLDLSAGYSYTLDLLDHSPLLSLHDLSLMADLPVRPWLHLNGRTGPRWRVIHDDSYRYLEALEYSATLSLKTEWRFLNAQAGYQVTRSWADPVGTQVLSGPSFPTYYQTNYSFLAHGPQLDLEVFLPLRISLRAAAWLLWHTFDEPDRQIQPMREYAWERSDLKVVGVAEVSRPIVCGLEAAVHFSSIDNLSSMDSLTPIDPHNPRPIQPIDRSYSRRLLVGSLRWRWASR